MKKIKKLQSTILILALLAVTSNASAETDDLFVCPSVYPCGDNGKIAPMFDVAGVCGDYWRSLCSEAELSNCKNQVDASESYITSLEKKLSRLQKKITKTQKSTQR